MGLKSIERNMLRFSSNIVAEQQSHTLLRRGVCVSVAQGFWIRLVD